MNDSYRTRESLIQELGALREENERLKSGQRDLPLNPSIADSLSVSLQPQDSQQLQAILNAIPVAVVVFDVAAGVYTMMNQRAHVLYGRDITHMSLDSHFQQVHPARMDGKPYEMGELPIMKSLASGAIVRNVEMLIQRPDGKKVQVLVNSAPLYPLDGEEDHPRAVIITLEDVCDIRKMEQDRSEIQKRQAFLLRLSDRLRLVADPVEIQEIAIGMLGEFLEADNAFYVEVTRDGRLFIKHEYHKPDAAPRVGIYGMDMLKPELTVPLMAGTTLAVRDLKQSPYLDAAEKNALASEDFRAFVTVPLNKQGRLLSFLSVLSLQPRNWRNSEISLVEEVADRTWAAVERALTEDSLQKSEEKFRTVLENLHEGICMIDLRANRITYASPSLQAMTGFSEGELSTFALKDILARTHPDEFEAYAASYRNLDEDAEIPLDAEYRWRIQSGTYRWFCDRRSVVRDEQGKATGLVIMVRDVTDQKEYENRIAFQSHLLENVHDAIIATDADFRLTYWNERAENLFGWLAEDALGRTTRELLDPILPEGSHDAAVGKLLSNDYYSGEVVYHHQDGTEIAVENRARVIRDAQGRVRETVTTIRDIRERKQAEEALKASQQHALALVEQLQESDRNKNRFISVLSHELRNPLAAIVMGLELLEHQGVREEQKKRAMDILNRQSEHLSCLVDDLLDVTRITENKIKLKKERIELRPFIEQLVLDHQASFETKGVTLQADLPNESIFVEADALRLNQVVTNLLHNALKFTRQDDSVKVTVCYHDPIEVESIGKAVCIKVTDTGAGMEQDLLSNLFIPFTQADRSLDRSQGGLGLGLSIVKGMVELHGGRVEAVSDGIGKGSTFTVILPVAP